MDNKLSLALHVQCVQKLTFATLFTKLDTFAQKLRYLRLERNLNQHEFANLLNRSFTSVCNWEQGVRIPKTETIKEIAEILNVDYIFLKDQE